MIECPCGWSGSPEELIAEWSDIEPHCPDCWGDDFIDIDEESENFGHDHKTEKEEKDAAL